MPRADMTKTIDDSALKQDMVRDDQLSNEIGLRRILRAGRAIKIDTEG